MDSFEILFSKYHPRFILFAKSYIHDEMAAEDIVMDAFVYYLENRKRLPEDANIPAYILTSIKHKCLNHLKHEQVKANIDNGLTDLSLWKLSTQISTLKDCDPTSLFSEEIQNLVKEALNEMNPTTREIFRLSRYENKTNREIAEILNISIKGVEYHMSKATKELREVLKDYLMIIVVIYNIINTNINRFY